MPGQRLVPDVAKGADKRNHHQLSSLPGEALDEAVRRLGPSRVLELGMHCGYSSVRVLRLLRPAGRLIAVELDPLAAELGEEVILVAGFKHSQVRPGKDEGLGSTAPK